MSQLQFLYFSFLPFRSFFLMLVPFSVSMGHSSICIVAVCCMLSCMLHLFSLSLTKVKTLHQLHMLSCSYPNYLSFVTLPRFSQLM